MITASDDVVSHVLERLNDCAVCQLQMNVSMVILSTKQSRVVDAVVLTFWKTLVCAISRQTVWVFFVNRLAKDCSVLLLRTLSMTVLDAVKHKKPSKTVPLKTPIQDSSQIEKTQRNIFRSTISTMSTPTASITKSESKDSSESSDSTLCVDEVKKTLTPEERAIRKALLDRAYHLPGNGY